MDLPFQLASEALEGLNFLNEAIDEEITRKVIVNAVKQILVNGPGKKKYKFMLDKVHLLTSINSF